MAADIPYQPADGLPIDWATELGRHRSWLRAVIYARLGRSDGVDDVFQEVSLAMLARNANTDASKVGPSRPQHIGAWLYRVAVRQAGLYLRTNGREARRREELQERQTTANPDDKEPLDWLLADERREHIRRALGRLLPEERELIVLKYTQDCSYRQMAGYLGVSVTVLQSRLHRARGRFREILLAEDLFEDET